MSIRILPGNIANMIAAGEVVQRPASAVKELMENAVDAGAGEVSVIVRDAGRTLIQVIDNGKGMSPEDAVLSFERHATSKISTADDLQKIMTFGFRGEALASIAAVAEVVMRTRSKEAEVGCEVNFAASKLVSTRAAACPQGTNICVRNLFYNVPARRKFLKSDNVEFKHIVEEFTRVALTRPETALSLVHNDREILMLRKAKSLKYRIQDIMGSAVVDKLVDVSADTASVRLSGFVGRPDLATKSLGNQFFFVNGRYFRSPYMHKAVMKAYEGLIAEGVTPSYFIYMEVAPETVDVNIHPAKTEVKFEDDPEVFQILFASIKEVLGRNCFGVNIDFEREDMPEMPVFGSNFEKYRPHTGMPGVDFDPDYNPFDSATSEGKGVGVWSGSSSGCRPQYIPQGASPDKRPYGSPDHGFNGYAYGGTAGYVDRRDDYGKLFEDKSVPHTATIVLNGKYIVTPVKSGLLVVDIRRARERIFYDRFLNAVSAGGHISKTTMFPIEILVGAAGRLVFDEHAVLLEQLGFTLEPSGEAGITVKGIPDGFPLEQSKVEALMADVLILLTEDHTALSGMLESTIAGKLARIGAERGKGPDSASEAQSLIDRLFSSSNPEFAPGGNRIAYILPSEEIEKKFN